MSNTEREAFEAWRKTVGWEFADSRTGPAWCAWQARAALSAPTLHAQQVEPAKGWQINLSEEESEALRDTIGHEGDCPPISLSLGDGAGGWGLYVWLTEDPGEEALQLCKMAQPEPASPELPGDEFERGRQQGMKQERALWELARYGQEIERAASPERVAMVEECKRLADEFGKAAVRCAMTVNTEHIDALTGADARVKAAIDRLASLPAPLVVPVLEPVQGHPAGRSTPGERTDAGGQSEGWVPMHERAPDPDTTCAVMLRYTLDRPPFVAMDTWSMQREDPTGMGGPTIEMGYGWDDNFEGDVIAWLKLPPMPPAGWDQRLLAPAEEPSSEHAAPGRTGEHE